LSERTITLIHEPVVFIMIARLQSLNSLILPPGQVLGILDFGPPVANRVINSPDREKLVAVAAGRCPLEVCADVHRRADNLINDRAVKGVALVYDYNIGTQSAKLLLVVSRNRNITRMRP